IFFVISGYLITSIILRDLQNNSFSIKNFYLRRIRRILPALIFVLVLSTFFAWLILLPQDLLNYAKSMVSVIASISNLFFFKTLSFGYFATDSSTIPLLHTWSLGVEEQFYIIWPVILIILFRLNASSKKYLLTITLLFITISIAIFFYKHFPKFYYIPLNRGFELLFGCFLAISLNNRELKLPNKILLNIYSILSLVLMIVPIFFISVSFSSFWMILACLGATLFIYSGSFGYTPVVNRLFSIKPFVAIGLISYSLYLWHWPIIAYLNYLSVTITTDIATMVILLSVVLATTSYLFVEKPFRHKFKFGFSKSLIILWIIPLVISIGFYTAAKYQEFGFNHPNIDQNKLTFKYGFEKIDNNGCFYNFAQDSEINRNGPYYVSYEKNYDSKKCKIFDNEKSHILVLGNSHARSDWPMISEWLKNIYTNATLLAITPNDNENTAPYAPYPNDLNQNIKNDAMKQRFDFIKKAIAKNSSYKTIIIANMGGIGNKNELNIFGLITKEALTNNKNIILIVDTPYLGQPASYLPENKNISNLCAINRIHLDCNIDYGIYREWIKTQTELYKKFKNQYPEQVEIINPSKIICSKNECKTTIKGIPIYADSHHLSYIGSKLIGQKYLEEFGNPITNDR
ncbi:acyltransferase, partial [Francisella noatunensis]